jgi:hypothetical protein
MTPKGREPGIETRWGAGDIEHPDIGGQKPAKATQQRQEFRLTGARRARIRIRQRVGRHIDMSDLPGGVHTRVGAPCRP